jgi:hypothetical protein
VIRLDQGAGRARRPVLTARKVRFEIDLLGGECQVSYFTDEPRLEDAAR